MDRLHPAADHRRPLRRDRHHVPHLRSRGVLRGGPAGSRHLQRDGDCGGLDVGRVVYRGCRHPLPVRLQRARVHPGVDGRICPGGLPARTVLAEIRTLHDSGFPGRPVWQQHGARGRRYLRGIVFVHLPGCTDLRGGDHHHPHDRDFLRTRNFRRAGQHAGLLVSWRHARGPGPRSASTSSW